MFSLVFLVLFWTLSCGSQAQTPASEKSARQNWEAAQSRIHAGSSNHVALAWELGRAAYDLADLVVNDSERSQVAQSGVDACRQALAIDSQSAPAHYYLALNLGELARGKRLGALRLLREMEHELLKAAELKPEFDYAGPDRALGILYFEAPIWPAGVGSRSKARLHLEKAVQLKPAYLENHLCLAEAYARWSEARNLDHELETIKQLRSAAEKEFPRETWAGSWKDWDARSQKLTKTNEHLAGTSSSDRGARRRK